jgi:hypothetical protein
LHWSALALVENPKSRQLHAQNMPDKPAKENVFQSVNPQKNCSNKT